MTLQQLLVLMIFVILFFLGVLLIINRICECIETKIKAMTYYGAYLTFCEEQKKKSEDCSDPTENLELFNAKIK